MTTTVSLNRWDLDDSIAQLLSFGLYYPNKSRQHFQISYLPLTLLLYETATTFLV